jgi:Zn-dependent protease with chaperone function
MNFARHQEQAERAGRRLLWLHGLATGAVVLAVNAAATLVWQLLFGDTPPPRGFHLTNSGVVLFLVLGGAWLETARLRDDGALIARRLGAVPVDTVGDPLHRRLQNLLEELAIAARIGVPRAFVLEDEPSINALTAGLDRNQAVVVVTRGALSRLGRDELQGVLAHEVSHIVNGDVRLNTRLVAMNHGLELVALFGRSMLSRLVTQARDRRIDAITALAAVPMAIAGATLAAVGSIGELAARAIKAGVGRQREFFADAQAVEFTRNRDGLGGALRKIAGLARQLGTEAAAAGAPMRDPRREAALRHPYWRNVSHLLLAGPTRSRGWFATHPSLRDRVQRLYGRYMDALQPLPLEEAQRREPDLPALEFDPVRISADDDDGDGPWALAAARAGRVRRAAMADADGPDARGAHGWHDTQGMLDAPTRIHAPDVDDVTAADDAQVRADGRQRDDEATGVERGVGVAHPTQGGRPAGARDPAGAAALRGSDGGRGDGGPRAGDDPRTDVDARGGVGASTGVGAWADAAARADATVRTDDDARPGVAARAGVDVRTGATARTDVGPRAGVDSRRDVDAGAGVPRTGVDARAGDPAQAGGEAWRGAGPGATVDPRSDDGPRAGDRSRAGADPRAAIDPRRSGADAPADDGAGTARDRDDLAGRCGGETPPGAAPIRLVQATRDAAGAAALVVALLQETGSPAPRWDEGWAPAAGRHGPLRAAVAALPEASLRSLRWPLIELAVARLRPLSLPAREALLATVRGVVVADGRVTLLEWIYFGLLRLRLAPRRPGPRLPVLGDPIDARSIRVLFALVAHAAQVSEAKADRAANAAIRALELAPIGGSAGELTLEALERAVLRAARLPPLARPLLVRQLVAMLPSDADASVRDFLRVLSIAIDCPPPNLPPRVPAPRRPAHDTPA